MKKLFASLRIIAVRTRPPPSPLPSPQGEGTCFDYVLNPLNADVAFDCQRVLPLPRGEGGGEGERAVQRHQWSAIRLGLLLVLAGSHMAAWGETTNTAIIPTPRDEKWMARHEGFLAEAGQIEPDVVFLGDSITDGWRSTGKSVWDERIAPLNAANFGIDGDRTQHVLWRIDHGEFDKVKPKVIVLMIGTNNTPKGRNSVPETIEGVNEIVHRLRTKLPKTKILLLGIFPRGQKGEPIRDELKVINQTISKLDEGKSVKYLDIGDKFLERDGTLPTHIMPDLLHPNKKGYSIWADAIEGTLKEMLKD